jgi:triacylglycerol esterase/lipase EstA (alpha/beta hydrolase family)
MNRFTAVLSDIFWIPVSLLSTIASPLFNVSDPSIINRNQTPILLLHGNGANELQFTYARYLLNQKFEGSVFSLQYDGVFVTDKQASIADLVERVADRCKDIFNKTGHSDIVIVGVSLGGLLGAYFKENLADILGTKVSRMITIGSPFHGSPLLEYVRNMPPWRSKRCEEMRVGSTFLSALREQVIKNLDDYIFIGSTEDLHVPYSHAVIDGGKTIKIEGLGHSVFHTAPSIWTQVRELI